MEKERERKKNHQNQSHKNVSKIIFMLKIEHVCIYMYIGKNMDPNNNHVVITLKYISFKTIQMTLINLLFIQLISILIIRMFSIAFFDKYNNNNKIIYVYCICYIEINVN